MNIVLASVLEFPVHKTELLQVLVQKCGNKSYKMNPRTFANITSLRFFIMLIFQDKFYAVY